jgi:hypothetical protein
MASVCEKKKCMCFGFSKQSPLSERNVVTELRMERIQDLEVHKNQLDKFLCSYLYHKTVSRAVHDRLNLHGYKVQIVETSKPDDKPRRFQFDKDNVSNVETDENYLRRWISVMKQRFTYQGV